MSIFVNKNTRLLVQGITGNEGKFHAKQCIEYGTNVVAGVTPGKGGQKMDDVPVFNTVKDAVKATDANCSLIFVPPPFAADAILEAADADIELIIAITEGIPVLDMIGAILRRKRRGVAIFSPDREHIHHKLMDFGFSNTIVCSPSFSGYLIPYGWS